MGSERRAMPRLPVGIYMTQYIHDRGFRCFSTNVSESGAFVNRLIEPIVRRTPVIQVELPIDSGRDTLWIKGEIAYDTLDPLFHGSGVRFLDMARKHRQWLREWLEDERSSMLRQMIHRLCDGLARDGQQARWRPSTS